MRKLLVLALLVPALAACGGGNEESGPPEALLHPAKLNAKAPQLFDITFHTTQGDFVINVHRTWAPKGADRLYNLAKNHFFDGQKFFRVVKGFVVQFGISPFPEVSKAWSQAVIPDDVITVHNTRGAVTFAAAGPNTRTTQIFINLGNNQNLDVDTFAPVGNVTSGMDVVDKLYGGYGDTPTNQQPEMQNQGNSWLEKNYPKLDSIKSAKITDESNPALP
jgi:cyclophilin family peptidyl-prolyl cis-trans isomerase